MDLTLPAAIESIRSRTRDFVAEEILPLETERKNFDEHENISLECLREVQKKARRAGLWSPQAAPEWGGMGLPVIGWAAMYEEANRSIFGPVCFNCAAPDDGNIHVLSKVATNAQKEKWLRPIVSGEVRSAFVMTEPRPGGGSDPAMIATRAEPTPTGQWRITGHKWFITGAEIATHFIVIARTSTDPRRGLTAFLFHRDQPGWHILRRIAIMGPEEHGGHCEIAFDGLEVPQENVLLEVGDGFRVAQIRLTTARLTHCMRWLGLSKRCMEIAQAYVANRSGFGVKLSERESVQLKLGEVAAAIDIGRLLVMRAAWKIDKGDQARKEVSMAKNHVAATLHQAADTGIQLNGARGYSKDTVLEWIYRYARQARLVDGASEVHSMVLARAYAKEGNDFWAWG